MLHTVYDHNVNSTDLSPDSSGSCSYPCVVQKLAPPWKLQHRYICHVCRFLHLCSLEPFINYFEYLHWWLIFYEISLLYIFYTRKVYVGGAWGYFCCCCCGSLFLSVPKLCQQYTAQLILKLLSTTFREGGHQPKAVCTRVNKS